MSRYPELCETNVMYRDSKGPLKRYPELCETNVMYRDYDPQRRL